jgi:hypothetical protein
MDRLTAMRLLVTAMAIVIWGYGLKVDDANYRIIGMSLLAAALILRFIKRFVRAEPPAKE